MHSITFQKCRAGKDPSSVGRGFLIIQLVVNLGVHVQHVDQSSAVIAAHGKISVFDNLKPWKKTQPKSEQAQTVLC